MSLHMFVDIAHSVEHKLMALVVGGSIPSINTKPPEGLISGELLIPDSLTTHIRLTECDNTRNPIVIIPNNHAPDAVALFT